MGTNVKKAQGITRRQFTDPVEVGKTLAVVIEERDALLAACIAFEKSWSESGGVGGNVREMIRAAIASARGK